MSTSSTCLVPSLDAAVPAGNYINKSNEASTAQLYAAERATRCRRHSSPVHPPQHRPRALPPASGGNRPRSAAMGNNGPATRVPLGAIPRCGPGQKNAESPPSYPKVRKFLRLFWLSRHLSSPLTTRQTRVGRSTSDRVGHSHAGISPPPPYTSFQLINKS